MALNGLFCADVPLRNYSLPGVTNALLTQFHATSEMQTGTSQVTVRYDIAAQLWPLQ